MQKTNFTSIRTLQFLFMSLLMLASFTNMTAQTLTCNDAVQVSVNNTPNLCQADLNADMFLEGDPDPLTNYYIRIMDGLNVVVPTAGGSTASLLPLTLNDLDNHFNDVLVVRIYAGDPDAGGAPVNSCWVDMTVEDKLAPIVTCTDATIACTADASLVAIATAVDNCDASPTVQLIDEVINTANNCTPGANNGTVTIAHTYVAIDNQGNTSASCLQTITVIRPDAVDVPDDLVWSCEQYAADATIIDATELTVVPVAQFESSNAWDLTGVVATAGSGIPSGVFPLPVGATNPANGDLASDYCKFAYSSADQILSTCGYTASTTEPVFKVVRTWTVLDWCTGNIVTQFSNPIAFGSGGPLSLLEDAVQIIKIVDNVEPTVTGADQTISANIPASHPQQCMGQGPIVLGAATDNCTGAGNLQGFVYSDLGLTNAVAQIQIVGTAGFLNPPLPIGSYYFVWTAEDGCGNIGQSNTYTLDVIDDVAPTAICDEITQVALSSDGKAVVYAGTFDDGSYDNCCLDHLEVRRMNDLCDVTGNTTFDGDEDNDNQDGDDTDPQDAETFAADGDGGAYVTFCCEDIEGTTADRMVVLRAYDCAGNYNECMVEVLVEDKLPPVVTCPVDAKISCDDYADVLDAALAACADDNCESDVLTAAGYGTYAAYDNCEAIVTTVVTINLDQCDAGTITRTYSVTDPSDNNGAPCTQTITVYHVSDWVVEFPADKEGLCDEAEPTFGEPEIFFETCELIATSYEDQFFDVVPDACFKIARQWTVINWCVIGDNIDEEFAEAHEASMGLDLDGDGDQDTRTFRDSWAGATRPGSDAATACFDGAPDTDPDANPWDGFITYQQIIKVIDNTAPVIDLFELDDLCIIDGDGEVCDYSGVLPTPTYSDCTLDVNGNIDNNGQIVANQLTITAVVFNAAGDIVSNSVVLTDLGIGNYTVRYTAIDRCGNTAYDEYDFEITDCKLPTPYCKDGLVLELMAINDPNNTTFEPMIEIWASDFDEGSYDNCPGGVLLSFSDDFTNTNAIFNCDHLGDNTIQLWVTDASGNQDFCETFVVIQANQGQCDGNGDDDLIAGNVSTEGNEDVQDVTVSINSPSGFDATQVTGANGNFSMTVPAGGDYTVTPSNDIDADNGVTTFDLVKISKHILNIESLDSPYKMIAADANNSNSITTIDLVHIRKLILLISDEYSNNTSWRFVDKAYNFPNASNPWVETFPEVISLNNISADQLANDFVAVKIGDVNGSATANYLLGADDRTFNGTLKLTTEEVSLKAGDLYTVEFTSADFNNLGYQFTMNFDADVLDFVEIGNGLATAENFGTTLLTEGAITTSWNNSDAVRMSAEEAVFTLTFAAKADAMLSEVLSINSRYTTAEAYAANGDIQDVTLEFNGTEVATFELYQNTPNPFTAETVIGFNLGAAKSATITISDLSGRVIKVIDGDFAKGYNQVVISRDEVSATGILYYQLDTDTDSATKKMILID